MSRQSSPASTSVSKLTDSFFNPEKLFSSWKAERFVSTPAPCLRPLELNEAIARLSQRFPKTDGSVADSLSVEHLGESTLGRPIQLLSLGQGDFSVLLWSQMHGDEPSATPALLDVANFLLSNSSVPEVRVILERLSLHMIPMLNPDGAEVYQRRNAQGIDINRDALSLSTPEGRILKQTRDRLAPQIGLNLHDQGRRTVVARTGLLSTLSVLAVTGDEAGTLTPGRQRTMRAAAAVVESTRPFLQGRIARYDEDWSPRAFGDNLTAWGTPVLLIESGGIPAEAPFEDLTRLNFVAILSTLYELARNDLADFDAQTYIQLPRTSSDGFSDVALRHAWLLQPQGEIGPYLADVTFNRHQDDRAKSSCRAGHKRALITEIGDGRFEASGESHDLQDHLITRSFAVKIEDLDLHAVGQKTGLTQDELLRRLARTGISRIDLRYDKSHKSLPEPATEPTDDPGLPEIRHLEAGQDSATFSLDGKRLLHLVQTLANGEAGQKPMSQIVQTITGSSDTASMFRALTVGASPFFPGTPAEMLVWRPSLETQDAAPPQESENQLGHQLESYFGSELVTVWRQGQPSQVTQP